MLSPCLFSLFERSKGKIEVHWIRSEVSLWARPNTVPLRLIHSMLLVFLFWNRITQILPRCPWLTVYPKKVFNLVPSFQTSLEVGISDWCQQTQLSPSSQAPLLHFLCNISELIYDFPHGSTLFSWLITKIKFRHF